MKQKFVVWGTRSKGQQLARLASDRGYQIIAYCSSRSSSQKKEINHLPVLSPEELKRSYLAGEVDSILLGVKNPVYLKEMEETIRNSFPANVSIIYPDKIENEHLIYVREHLRYRWNVKFMEQAKIWLENLASEVDFWVNEVANPEGRFHSDYMYRLANKDFLGMDSGAPKTPDSKLVERLKSDAVVMDIGCGLYSLYGTKLPNSETIQLIAVDPLAPFYNRINQKCTGGKFRAAKFGMFEFASNFFEENYCDVILINNALDHCIDPYKSLIECLYVLKKGGTMRLWHSRAEALNRAYDGLHKWNVDYSKDHEFVIWNQENAVNISQELKGIADVQVTHTSDDTPRNDQSVTVEIVKKRDFQLQEFFDMAEERRQLAFLIEGLMHRIAEQDDSYLKNL